MAINDNVAQEPFLQPRGAARTNSAPMQGMQPFGKGYRIKINIGGPKASADGMPGINKGFESDEGPDTSDALVQSSQILHPVRKDVSLKLTSMGDVWTVGRAEGMLPGTLVIKNHQPAGADQDGPTSKTDNNDHKVAGLDSSSTPKTSVGNLGGSKTAVDVSLASVRKFSGFSPNT